MNACRTCVAEIFRSRTAPPCTSCASWRDLALARVTAATRHHIPSASLHQSKLLQPSHPPLQLFENTITITITITMTKNPPQQLRKSASNADLYSDPSPPHPLRHAYSTLSRAHTTASLSHRPRVDRAAVERGWNRQVVEELRNRHSIAATPSYGNLIDIDEEIKPQQRPPPVPPKIPEEVRVEVKERKFEEKVARVPSHPWCPVPALSKEGPEKYTKPFTDFMTAKYVQTLLTG
jgi:hypothetical protein